MDLSAMGFLLIVNLILLVLGGLLEGGTILLVIVPILIPTAKLLGIDMVHFGLVVTVNLMIGLITPPYGLLLFIMANITGESIKRIVTESLPFLAVMIGALMFITYVPDAVLWLPRMMGYQG
jgi:TRAP-type C4-dicarboxylate transport system permease large subunit